LVISSKLKRRNRARVELPRILEKKGLIVVDLLSEYPPFIVPDIIKLDEPDLWIHEFVEASLWELLPNCARAQPHRKPPDVSRRVLDHDIPILREHQAENIRRGAPANDA
jgi:hypothetical protein